MQKLFQFISIKFTNQTGLILTIIAPTNGLIIQYLKRKIHRFVRLPGHTYFATFPCIDS